MIRADYPDGRARCGWANPANQRYIAYHDSEWGRPLHDDRALFELLVLETFQAGLSWECVLNKRDAFRRAFAGFDPKAVAAFGPDKLEALRQDAGIIRNRKKIAAAVANAQAFLAIRKEWGSFDAYLWHWTDGATLCEWGPTSSNLSDKVSADLKSHGMRFVGTTVVYAYLQAAGVIDAHEPGCFLASEQDGRAGTPDAPKRDEAERASD